VMSAWSVGRLMRGAIPNLQQFSVGRIDFDRGGRKGARRLADSS
jgi:hypothetical protein